MTHAEQLVRARRRDPSTSHDAAKRAERFAQSHIGRILSTFQAHRGTWTAQELSSLTGLTVVQIDRRLHEIPQIERTGGVIDGYTCWRLRPEPCYFVEAGEADRKALGGTN